MNYGTYESTAYTPRSAIFGRCTIFLTIQIRIDSVLYYAYYYKTATRSRFDFECFPHHSPRSSSPPVANKEQHAVVANNTRSSSCIKARA